MYMTENIGKRHVFKQMRKVGKVLINFLFFLRIFSHFFPFRHIINI